MTTGRQFRFAVVTMAWGMMLGCGSSPRGAPSVVQTPVSTIDSSTTDDPIPAASGVSAADIDAISKLTPQAREEVDVFAFSTLQLQRLTLLQESRIQDDLQLTPPQIAEFTKLGQEVQQMRTTLQTLSGDQRRDRLQNEYLPKTRAYQQQVDDLLDDRQQQLLFRRVVQRQPGAIVFLLPGVPDALGLTAVQRAELYNIAETTRLSVNMDNLDSVFEKGKLLLRAKAARSEAEAQLTDAQKAAWAALMEK
jgi:hypothetical protein